MANALKWLESQQSETGYWVDRGEPDTVFLTVLVLDAMTHAAQGVYLARADVLGPFKVALSFPGTVRARVASVAQSLSRRLGKSAVFYDNFYKSELARPNLDLLLQDVYRDRSKLLLVFVGRDYHQSDWCGLEWRAIRDIIKSREDERIMFVRVDDARVPGMLSIDGYIDLRTTSTAELTAHVVERLATLGL